jgi:hypothetical protein
LGKEVDTPLLGKTTGVQPGEYIFVVVGVGFAQIWRGIKWKSFSMIGLNMNGLESPSLEQFIYRAISTGAPVSQTL